MYDDLHFLRDTIVDISAAVVGISKNRWISIDEAEATATRATEIMRDGLFDVLPITTGSTVKDYYQTNTWNDFSSVSRRAITHRDVIPLQTPIRDVIKGLSSESRLFYFLASGSRVAGLLSLANLNSREVKVYLFSLLSELEVRLATYVSEAVPENELLGMDVGARDQEIRTRYEEDRTNGVEAPFVEYLYLGRRISISCSGVARASSTPASVHSMNSGTSSRIQAGRLSPTWSLSTPSGGGSTASKKHYSG
jgi:hypothetical protein